MNRDVYATKAGTGLFSVTARAHQKPSGTSLKIIFWEECENTKALISPRACMNRTKVIIINALFLPDALKKSEIRNGTEM